MKSSFFIGWDIGGANTKVCVFDKEFNIIEIKSKNINVWKNFKKLNDYFHEISNQYNNYNIQNFITITAESCDNFDNRRSGIISIIENCNLNIYGSKLFYSNNGKYLKYDEALLNPDSLFSTNWMLTLKYLNTLEDINLIIDVGSTTTDIIYKNMSIEENIDDHKRLANNTLFYAGVIRTPLPMLINKVSFFSKEMSLVNEVFSTTGDIFNVTNDIDFDQLDYIGADSLNYTKKNSYMRIARSLGLDYKNEIKTEIIDMSYTIKNNLIDTIYEKIKLLFNNNIGDIKLLPIGEGNFLIKELALKYNLKYFSLKNSDFFSNKKINENILNKSFTAVLVVKNYFINNGNL